MPKPSKAKSSTSSNRTQGAAALNAPTPQEAVAEPTVQATSGSPDMRVEDHTTTLGNGNGGVATDGNGEESFVVGDGTTTQVEAPHFNEVEVEPVDVVIPEGDAVPVVDVADVGESTAELLHPVMLVHPAADLFPLLPDDQLAELADDIRLRGLIEPVVTIDVAGVTMILDGRNRARACILAGVEPRTVPWDGSGGSPSGFVLSKNIHRRHLTPAQRAAIAVDLLPMLEVEARERQVAAAVTTNARLSAFEADGVATPDAAGALIVRGRSRDLAASALGVSGRSVQEAKTISEQAPEVLAEVRGGALSLPEGRRIAALPSPDDRKAAIKKAKVEKGIPKKRVPKVTAATPKPADVLDAVRAAVGDLGRLLDGIPKEKRPLWWMALRKSLRAVAP